MFLRSEEHYREISRYLEVSKRVDILHVHFITIEVGIVGGSARDLLMRHTLAIAKSTYTERFNRKASPER